MHKNEDTNNQIINKFSKFKKLLNITKIKKVRNLKTNLLYQL